LNDLKEKEDTGILKRKQCIASSREIALEEAVDRVCNE
jgi:hypothetical protein